MILTKIKQYVELYLKDNFDEILEDFKIIRKISLKELNEMDYFEGNSEIKPKGYKKLEDKFNNGDYYNHCEILISKCPCYEVQGKNGKYCISQRIMDLYLNNWEYELDKGVKEEHFLNIIKSGNTYSSKKIMNNFNNFLIV